MSTLPKTTMEFGMSALEHLKKTLDDEMLQEDTAQMIGLMKSKLGSAYVKMLADSKRPSELLNFLENNMPEDDVMSVAFHVLATMKYHVENKNIAEYIASYQKSRMTCHGRSRAFVVGRDDEIENALSLLQNNKGVLIYGPGGYGKTTFANELCARCAFHNKADTFVVDMRQSRSINDLFKGILEVQNIVLDGDNKELQNEVWYRLKGLQNETLFHLDNMEHVYDAMPNELGQVLGRLEEFNHKVKWVVTSREKFVFGDLCNTTKLKEFELKALNDNAAAKLLIQSCRPVCPNGETVQYLLKKCSNIPLAICLIGKTLADFCDTESQLTRSFLERYLLPSVTQGMQGCLKYAFDRLDAADQITVAKLSFLGTVTFDVECVSYILDVRIDGENGALMLMMLLTTKHIVQRESPKCGQLSFHVTLENFCYSFHPFIAQYISQCVRIPTETLSKAKQRFCSYMQRKVEPLTAVQDRDYEKAIHTIQQNRDIILLVTKVLTEINTVALSESENNFIGKALETSVHSFAERQSLFERISESFQKDVYSCCFWKIEMIKGFINSKDPVDLDRAAELIDAVRNIVETISDETGKMRLSASLFYLQGRLERTQNISASQYNTTQVLSNFRRSLDLYTHLSSPEKSYGIELSLILNAMGNVYFDEHDVDKAYMMHENAAKTIREYTQNEKHPYLTLYEFNTGTVALAKAEYQLKLNDHIDEKANQYYLEALRCFNFSMLRDKDIGRDRLPQYGDKLSYRAKVYEKLSKFDDALHDREEALALFKFLSVNDDSNYSQNSYLKALIKKGGTHLQQSKLFERGKAHFKTAIKKALECFEKVEDCIINGRSGKLEESVKLDYIADFRSVAKSMPSLRKREIEAFCLRYESNESFDSSSSSETSSKSDSSTESERNSDSGLEEMEIPITSTSPNIPLYKENKDTLFLSQHLQNQYLQEKSVKGIIVQRPPKRRMSSSDDSDS